MRDWHQRLPGSVDHADPLDDPIQGWRLALLIGLAWAVGVALRLLWLPEATGVSQTLVDGVPMPTTGDAFVWGASIKSALAGLEETIRLPDWGRQAVTALGVAVAKVSPWSVAEVLFYLPVLVGSLLVVPVVLLGRLLGSTWLGLVAALLAVGATSYVARTSLGYYDTDMFSVTVQATLLLALVGATLRRSLGWALLAGLTIATYRFTYDKGGFVALAQLAAYGAMLLIARWRDPMTPSLIAVVALGFLPAPMVVRIAVVVGAYLAVTRWRPLSWRLGFIGGGILLALMLATGTGREVARVISRFVGDDAGGDALFTFFGERLIAETQGADLATIGFRISGHVTLLVAAVGGYAVACWRWRPLLLGLPLWLLGLSAFATGLRFTIYAVPVASLGLAVVMWALAGVLPRLSLRRVMIAVLAVGALVPLVIHATRFTARVNLDTTDVAGMQAFGQLAAPEDYAVAWWDYGYPLAYYAGTNTLVDGGHHGRDSALVARLFTSRSPVFAANLSRLAVEISAHMGRSGRYVLGRVFREYNQDLAPNAFLDRLTEASYTPPAKTREAYLYMPLRMLPLLATVYRYAAIDIETGAESPTPMFIFTPQVDRNQAMIALRDGFVIDAKNGLLIHPRQTFKLRTLIRVTPAEAGLHKVLANPIHPDGAVTAIWIEVFNAMIVVDDALLYSNLIQMMLLDRWDDTLFEPVLRTPQLRVYRLRK